MSNIAKSYIFVLFFILLTNNTRYGIVTVTLGGISPIRSIKELFTWMRHVINVPPYVYRKIRQNYVHAATNDDIQLNRFIFLDLYSTKHYKDIRIVELPDDPENEWQNIRLYEMSPNAHKPRNGSSISSTSSARVYNPNDDILLTIGCVYYYAQTLQCKLNYDTRKVMTYFDAQKRFCVHIESYDSSGFVKSKRIFREKKKSWWLRMLLSEEVTVTSMVLSGDIISVLRARLYSIMSHPEDLDIPSRTIPKFMIGKESNLGCIYYNIKKDAGVPNLRTIIFRNEPVQLENIGNILNVCIFNYVNDHKQTDFIVICQEEKGKPYKCTFYKCLSHADRHYEILDSFTTSSPRITLEECTYDVADSKRNSIIVKHSRDSLLPSNIDNLLTVIYLDSNHLVIHPLNIKTAPLIKSIDINDSTGHKTLEAVRPQGTFISIQQCGPTFQQLSIATTGKCGNSYKTLFVYQSDAKKRDEFDYEVHMRTMISTIPSPYLLSKSAVSRPATQGYRMTFYDEERIVAKLNDKTTFFAHNFGRGEYKFLQSIDFDGVSLEMLPNINSQVLYCQTQSKEFVVLSQAYNAPKIYELNGDKFVEATGDSRNLLENADLVDFIGTLINPDKWTEIALNFNDVVLSENVDVLILSSDATLYTTSYGHKITHIIWGASTIKLDGGWTQVTRITTDATKYLLVDMLNVEDKTIHRQLYEYETSDDSNEVGKLRLVSKSEIDDLNKTSLDETRLKIQNSYYDIIPNLPGIFADFNDARLEHDEFTLNKLSIIYPGFGSKLTIGDFEEFGRRDEVSLEHKWRQVFMNKHSDLYEYKVFTLTRKGISSTHITKSETKKYLLPFNSELPQLRSDAIPLIIDSINMSNIKITRSNLGGTEITTFKAAENRKINPVVFGNHEIRLLGETVVTVTKVTVDGLSHITIEDEGDTNKTLQFEQLCKGSAEYKLFMEGDTVFIPFVDMKGLHAPMIDSVTFPGESGTRPEYPSDTNVYLISEVKMYLPERTQAYTITSHYIVTLIEAEDSRYLHYPSEFVWSYTYGSPNIIDFNEQKYPNNIRYITLNESHVYFTGVTQTGGLKFVFGDRSIDIGAAGVRYHVWVRFPHGSVKTADLYISYLEGNKRTRAGHCLESTDHTSRLKMPKYRLNWGPLNLMESFFVNRNLLNMAVHNEDFFPVDIHLQNKEHEKGIVKLTVDDNTDIYTTLAFNKLVINNVRFKNTVIKGTPKQLNKYVFHSKVDDDNIILIATKTLNDSFTIAYAFKNDGSFKQISLDNINYGTHHGLRIFKR